MYRFLILVIAAIGGAFLSSPAKASGDYGCTPQWSVVQFENGGCNNSAILGPGNDTRVNLLLLMQDFYPHGKGAQSTGVEPLFEWRSLRNNLFYQKPGNNDVVREHTRCGSNADGAAAFEKAVNGAKNLSAAERGTLINARKIFEPECGIGMREIPFRIVLNDIKSKQAQEFADYMRAAITFYDGDFNAAGSFFSALSKAKDNWVRETAQYMFARNALNQAQDNAFDEWGYFDGTRKTDDVALGKARDGFQNYLKNWPKGQYAYSARSLMRRVYWLGNDPAKLAAEYRWHLGAISFGESEDLGRANHAILAEEIDSKLLPRDNGGTFGGDPLFLAVNDLMRMRKNGGYFGKQISRTEIEAQRPVFAKHPELHQYLLAAYAFYVDQKPADVIAMIPDSARFPRMGFVHFSRQALRGLALDAVKDRNARGFWEELVAHAGAVPQSAIAEMALAMNMERGNAVPEIFATQSLVQDITVRELLMLHVASPAILRAQAADETRQHHEREVALFTLLYKGLSRGRYGEFVSDLNLTPKGALTEGYFSDLRTDTEIPVGLFKSGGKVGDFACPHVRESASVLAKNANDVRARLCVADFFRLNGFDQMQLETSPEQGQLGSGKSLFPGKAYSRLELYKGLIADPKTAAEEKAYALYRAVYCYAPGGNNSCSGAEVPQSQRKAWHDQLKREYPKSPWAQKLQFYW
jgi:hypothetical protein